MAHIHDKIDFAVSIFVVNADKVLFIKHKQLGIWLPVGGHVELDEDPESAALREVKEESGLDVKLHGTRPNVDSSNARMLIPPCFLDIHQINLTHKHVGMVYFATSKNRDVKLAAAEHDDIRWLSASDLEDETYGLLPQIRFYAQEALRLLGRK